MPRVMCSAFQVKPACALWAGRRVLRQHGK
jgi:hypothetical protein